MKLPIGLLIVTLIALSGCKKEEEQKEEMLRPVRYQQVGTSSSQTERTFSGVTKASNELVLSFRAGGIITQVNVNVGDRVRKGDLIARLDNVEAMLALEKAVSAVNSAKSDLNTAKNELDRVKSLYERNSISLSEYQATRNAYQIALSQYESAQRNKNIQETQVGYGYIYAPKDGVIASTDGSVDENVASGHQFAILNAGEEMQVEVGVAENIINQLKMGMSTGIEFSAMENATYEGVVVEIAQIPDPNSATYPVKIDIVNPDAAIRPGMAASVTFTFGEEEEEENDMLVVPAVAVGEDGGGNYVFVIEPQDDKVGVARKRQVVVGQVMNDGFEIEGGLKAGELVATAGLQTLLDGQKVSIQ